MMKALKGQSMPVEGKDKEAKMAVLKELMQVMNSLMADDSHMEGQHEPMDAMPGDQVTVAAKDPKDLASGLSMAKEMVSGNTNPAQASHPMDMNPDMPDDDEEGDEYY